MVQAINTKAIFTLASVIRRPSLLVPHVSVATVSALDFARLKEAAGVEAVLFDKDNTLTAPYDNSLHPDAEYGLQEALRVFGKHKVAILSNSAGTPDDPGFKAAMAIETQLGISVVRHKEKKPGGINEVLQHFSLERSELLCIIGDRLLTDIVFGNLYGMLTVHTLPLCSGNENANDNWTAKLIRPVENRVLYGRVGRSLLPARNSHVRWPGRKSCPLTLPGHRDLRDKR